MRLQDAPMTRRITFRVIAVSLCLLFPAAQTAQAAGPIGGYETDEASGGNTELAKAIKLIGLGSYASAIPLLKKAIATDPSNPDAFSLMGFSLRKLGERDTALRYYTKALELAPEHLGANEYLGELYLEMSDLTRARERLDILETACGTSCNEYLKLEKAIMDFKAAN